MNASARTLPSRQGGMTILLVLVLLSVMLMGGLALARVTEVGTLAAGNSSYREVSLQASEVGLNTAFVAVNALTNEEAATGSWYWPTMQSADARGVPTIDWEATPELTVGQYRIRYAVDRMCNVAPLTDSLSNCLVREVPDKYGSTRGGGARLESPHARQFRVTIRVVGPKNTETWVQSLMTRKTN